MLVAAPDTPPTVTPDPGAESDEHTTPLIREADALPPSDPSDAETRFSEMLAKLGLAQPGRTRYSLSLDRSHAAPRELFRSKTVAAPRPGARDAGVLVAGITAEIVRGGFAHAEPLLVELRVCLAAQPVRWTSAFFRAGGAQCLETAVCAVREARKSEIVWSVLREIVASLKIIASDKNTLRHALVTQVFSTLAHILFAPFHANHTLSESGNECVESTFAKNATHNTNVLACDSILPPLTLRTETLALLASAANASGAGWTAVMTALAQSRDYSFTHATQFQPWLACLDAAVHAAVHRWSGNWARCARLAEVVKRAKTGYYTAGEDMLSMWPEGACDKTVTEYLVANVQLALAVVQNCPLRHGGEVSSMPALIARGMNALRLGKNAEALLRLRRVSGALRDALVEYMIETRDWIVQEQAVVERMGAGSGESRV